MTTEKTTKSWHKIYGSQIPKEIPKIEYPHLGHLVDHSCDEFQGKKAFTVYLPNGMYSSLTFNKVKDYSHALAAYFKYVLKLKPGTRIAIQLPNCLDYPIALFACFKTSYIVVNINPLYTPRETLHVLKDSEAEVILVFDMFAHQLNEIIKETKVTTVIPCSIADFFPFILKKLIQFKVNKDLKPYNFPFISLERAISIGKEHSRKPLDKPKHEDTVALQYTGGTTGVSKGVVLTQSNFLSQVNQFISFTQGFVTPGEEVILTALPLYHIFSLSINGICFFERGAHGILIPNPRPLTNLEKPFKKHKITWISGVNTLYNGLLNEPWFQKNPPRFLKIVIAGGMALHKVVADKWKTIVGVPILGGYGLTESCPVLTFNPPGHPPKDGTVGIPIPSTDIRIVDDKGADVAIGETGEVIAQGPQVMSGYWNHAEETALVLKDGWLYTGDMGFLDEDGYLTLVDRKKDIIIVSGFNVYPNEVEDCIALHPDIKEVAVIGIPDLAMGEKVEAHIVSTNPHLTAEDVIKHCRTVLTSYKVPKSIVFAQELPKTPIGKILRRLLKKPQ